MKQIITVKVEIIINLMKDKIKNIAVDKFKININQIMMNYIKQEVFIHLLLQVKQNSNN